MKITHWCRVTHICISKLTTIGSDNGLSPGRRQAITCTNAEIILIGHLGTNFSGHFIEIQTSSFMKMHLKMSSGKWRPFCLGLNVFSFRNGLMTYTHFFKCKHFRVTVPLCGVSWNPPDAMDSPTVWTNFWTDTRLTGYSSRQEAHLMSP